MVDELGPGHVAGEDLLVGEYADGVRDAHGELSDAPAPSALVHRFFIRLWACLGHVALCSGGLVLFRGI